MSDPFATAEDLEAFLQIPIDAEHLESAERALRASTAAIRNYCEQVLSLVEDDTIVLDTRGGSELILPELPVVAVTEVVELGELLAPDDDYKLGQHGILHRIGRDWPVGIQAVVVTYDHGYAVLPDDIVDIATRAAARVYQAGLRSADNAGVMGVASKSLGDFSVAFTPETGGGASEGVLGVSAARPLLLSEKDLLDRYKP